MLMNKVIAKSSECVINFVQLYELHRFSRSVGLRFEWLNFKFSRNTIWWSDYSSLIKRIKSDPISTETLLSLLNIGYEL